MSRKRRILILTEAAFSTVRQAMRYVEDQYDTGDGDGDVSHAWSKANQHVSNQVAKTPIRNADDDARALATIIGAAIDNSCSCPGFDAMGVNHGAKEHKASGHCNDCFAATHHRELERVRALLQLLRDAAS